MCGDFIRIFVWVFEIYGHIAVAAVVAFGRQFLFRGAAFAWHTILKRINFGRQFLYCAGAFVWHAILNDIDAVKKYLHLSFTSFRYYSTKFVTFKNKRATRLMVGLRELSHV